MTSAAHMLGGSGSGVPRGGGAALSGRRLKGAPKSCQIFKKFIYGEILKI